MRRVCAGIVACMLAASAAHAGDHGLTLGQYRRMIWRCASYLMIAAPINNQARIGMAMREADRGSNPAFWVPESSAIFADVVVEHDAEKNLVELYDETCRIITDRLAKQPPDLSPPIPVRARPARPTLSAEKAP